MVGKDCHGQRLVVLAANEIHPETDSRVFVMDLFSEEMRLVAAVTKESADLSFPFWGIIYLKDVFIRYHSTCLNRDSTRDLARNDLAPPPHLVPSRPEDHPRLFVYCAHQQKRSPTR